MAKRVPGFLALDGNIYADEREADTVDIRVQIERDLPALKGSMQTILDNATRLADILLVVASRAVEPPVAGENTTLTVHTTAQGDNPIGEDGHVLTTDNGSIVHSGRPADV